MFGRTFSENAYVLKCNNFNTGLVAAERLPASGSFLPVHNYDGFVFLIGMGTLDSATTFTVYQDKGVTETSDIKVITGAVAIVADDDDNQWVSIEVAQERLDIANGFTHVTLVPSGAAGGNDYGCIFFIGLNPREVPVTQPANYSQKIVVAG